MSMWRKENSHALLVILQIGAATVENRMEFPQKIENRTTIEIPTSGYLFKEIQNTNSKRYVHFYVTAALSTIAKIWKQPKGPLIDN